MRMLVLSIEYPPLGGGASPMIHEINKQFILRGHEVTVVTMAYSDLPSHENVDGVAVFRINSFRRFKHKSRVNEHLAFLYTGRKFLDGLVTLQQFDICFAHFLVPTGILARWLHKAHKIPYIITAHGSDIPGFNPDRFLVHHWFTPMLIRSIIHSSMGVVLPSRYLMSMIIQVKGVDKEKLVHIPNGIDTDVFVPGPKKNILLSTGRLLPRKGFQHLIDAIADEPFPFEVHICGDGPVMNILKEKSRYSKTKVIFHGWIDGKSEQYKTLLSQAAIYCLVSAKENASISLLEALSAGCAVITSNVSGCPESVGEAGICIPPGDIIALKTALRKLVTQPELMIHLGKEARERAVHNYSWANVTEKYLALITQPHNQ